MQNISSNPEMAVSITAAQVVFTNVEIEESPHGHRGFQTVFYTEDRISEDVLRSEIEPTLQYFPRNGVDPSQSPPEFVFFSLSNNQIAVGKITPLLDKLDKFGRKKMLFAHLLVFDAPEFRAVFDNNPFKVIDTDPFYDRYEDVISTESVFRCRINIPKKSIVVRRCTSEFNSLRRHSLLMNERHLLHLCLLASARATKKSQLVTLEVHGHRDSLLALIRSFFEFIPPSFRSACSFDTYFVGDTGQAKSSSSGFWLNGVGKGQRLQQSGVVRIDLDSCGFLTPDFTPKNETPFERWLLTYASRSLTPLHSSESQYRIHTAAILQEILWGRCRPPTESAEIDNEVFKEFLVCNRDYIKGLLRKNFAREVGQMHSATLSSCAYQWISQNGTASLAAVPRKFPPHLLCSWLLQSLKTRVKYKPSELELEELSNCFTANCDRVSVSKDERALRAMFFYWKKNWSALQEVLSGFDRDSFVEISGWMISAEELSAFPTCYLRVPAVLFFGFLGCGFSADGDSLLRTLTFLDIKPGAPVPAPIAGVGFCRKVVLKQIIRVGVAAKKNSEPERRRSNLDDERAIPLSTWVTEEILPTVTRRSFIFELPPPATGSVNVCAIGVSEGGQAECLERLATLCESGDMHFAYFWSGAVGFVGALRRNGSTWAGTVALFNAAHFEAHQCHPFAVLQDAFGVQEWTKTTCDNRSRGLAVARDLGRALQNVYRGSRFEVGGSPIDQIDAVRLLFDTLPDRLRQQCWFVTGELRPDFALRHELLVSNKEETAPQPQTSAGEDAAESKGCRVEFIGLNDFEPASAFEKCLQGVSEDSELLEIAFEREGFFNQLFSLSELLSVPQRRCQLTSFSDIALRVFAKFASAQIATNLNSRYSQRVGRELASILTKRSCQLIQSQLHCLPRLLQNRIDDAFVVEQITTFLLSEHSELLSTDVLREVGEALRSVRRGNSLSELQLRVLYRALVGDADFLAAEIERIEEMHFGASVEAALAAVWRRVRKTMMLEDWTFTVERTDEYGELHTELGVCLQLALGTGIKRIGDVYGVIAGMFGCNISTPYHSRRSAELVLRHATRGKFWPAFIEVLHDEEMTGKQERADEG